MQRGVVQSPGRNWISVHFSLKIRHMVPTILTIFPISRSENAILDITHFQSWTPRFGWAPRLKQTLVAVLREREYKSHDGARW